ncbi:MAG: protein-L-isoaspartate(D-aspartate) O-methyltransferase [Theionarchaea archaeon]|nr:protein-L-isoaspartate(D-aspartate) O-methyltransferase [Theionarchaea archaeon]
MNRNSLVTWLKRGGYIKSPEVEAAFRSVNREQFVLPEHTGDAYHDSPLPILRGQTISAPSMIAIMLEVAELRPGVSVLEIGCGSGYNGALIAEIVGEENVITIERIPELAEWGKKNLESAGYRISVIVGDGTLGYPLKAPYDRIISTAAAPRIPSQWIDQLSMGGLIVCPVGSRHWYQELQVLRKSEEGSIDISYHGGCAFVPLIGKEGFRQ